MDDPRPTVESVADRLKQWPLVAELASGMLAVAGPLTVLAAQTLYLAAPLLSSWTQSCNLAAWAELLEDPAQVEALRSRLEEATR